MTAVYIGVFGALGASCRFIIMRHWPGWAALLVINFAGSFTIGLVATRAGRWVEPVAFGALGTLTSYSSFSLIADDMGSRSRARMIAYVLVTIIGALTFTGAGRGLGD